MPIPESLAALRLPVVAAPMFLTSGPELVAACCEGGVLGTFPALNQRTTEGFDAWLTQLEERLAGFRERTGQQPAPYAVNLIVHRTNPRVSADLEVIVKHRVPVVITSLGAAREVVDAVHGYGGLVFHDVTTAKHGKKAAEAGVDGLILVSAGAGGHAGTLNPFALVSEIRAFFDKTVLLAGCISTGSDVAAAQMMGADLAYMGTRFIATKESLVGESYKQMIVDSGASEILYTPAISSIPANFLVRSIQRAGLDPNQLEAPDEVDLGHITQPYAKEGEQPRQEAKAWKDIWSAGQGVAAIDDVPPASELIARLIEEYRTAVAQFSKVSAPFSAA